MQRYAFALTLLGIFSSHVWADNWPQWRGPTATGAAAEGSNPPTEWSETKNVKWKAKLPGQGTSAPIIWEDKIFIQTAIELKKETKPEAAAEAKADAPESESKAEPSPDRPKGRGPGGRGPGGFGRGEKPTNPVQFVLMCLDRKTGKTLWEKVAHEEVPHEGHHKDHGYSSASPVTDGKHVWAYFGSRGLFCFDFDGNLKWEKQFGKMQTRNGFGEGSSPALFDNTIVITWDHEGDDFIVALDATDGKELWRQKRSEPTTWATPLIVQYGNRIEVITPGTERVRSYDLKTGEILWQSEGLTTNAIPSPVTADGVVFLTSGFKGSALRAVKLGASGDITGTDAVLWTHNKNTPYVPSPLLYGNKLYFFSSNKGILSSIDVTTGKPLIETQRIGTLENVYSSPVGAGGNVYLIGRNGTTVVIKNADKFEQIATNELSEPLDASPAVVGNELFLRGDKSLYCIAESK